MNISRRGLLAGLAAVLAEPEPVRRVYSFLSANPLAGWEYRLEYGGTLFLASPRYSAVLRELYAPGLVESIFARASAPLVVTAIDRSSGVITLDRMRGASHRAREGQMAGVTEPRQESIFRAETDSLARACARGKV